MKRLLKIVSLILILFCVANIFVACSDKKHGKITTDYAQLHNIDKSCVSFICYGEFRGTHVVMFNELAPQVLTSETVDGVTFNYPTTIHLTAYKNGYFYSLSEAFEQGLLTHGNLVTLRDKYNIR